MSLLDIIRSILSSRQPTCPIASMSTITPAAWSATPRRFILLRALRGLRRSETPGSVMRLE
jgi:hypothetical protein